MENLKNLLEIIQNRKQIIKEVPRARNITHVDGSSEIKTYYQTVVLKNKIRKKEIKTLKKILILLINNLDDNKKLIDLSNYYVGLF